MTDVGMSDVAATPAAPASVPLEQMSPEQAQEAIRARIHDKDFGAKLLAKDPAATAEWTGLHRVGFLAPQQPASVEDSANQQAARNAEGWNQYVGWLRQQWNLTPENEAEVRAGVIREQDYKWAQEEKARLIKDRGFYRRLMDGDRAAKESWAE
jgi:hypothetical protein